nr:hypothetical protein GCM10020092_090760 [Actinoplanes digitatis]
MLEGQLQRLALDQALRAVGGPARRGGTVRRLGRGRRRHGPLHRFEVHAEVADELAGVLGALLPVFDLGDQRRRATHGLDPALDGVQVEAGQGLPQREVDERLAAGDHVADRQVALGQPQLAGVHVVRADRDERAPDEALVLLERAQGRLLAKPRRRRRCR